VRPLLTFAVILSACTLSFGQDLKLRQEAVQMIERAHSVSWASNYPSAEQVATFRVLDSASGPQQGSYSRVDVQGTGRRVEVTFGDYHTIDVYTAGRRVSTARGGVTPPEIYNVKKLLPIYLVRFDHEDVIYAMTDSSKDGKPLRCIQFNTVAGQEAQDNELCVDSASGTLVSARLGKETIENSEFFPFADSFVPGRITYSYAGVPKLEISQTIVQLTEVTPDVLAAPPGAQMYTACSTFRRALGVLMPQPQPGRGGQDTDLILRGLIAADGKVHDAIVQSSDRPDLNPAALRVIQDWIFTPAMCDGNPVGTEASFTLHFKAQ
jgi:TonB family protein